MMAVEMARAMVGEAGVADYPSLFWLWNDRLDASSLRRRVDALADWGIRSFIIHPMPDDFRKGEFRGGMTTPYLSRRYFACVRATVAQAAARGMQVWLYDDGGWPSGLANGQIVARYPELAAQVMTRRGVEVRPDRTDLLNARTTAAFLAMTHAGYAEALGEYFGTTVPGIFTDEPTVCGQTGTPAIPWTPDMPAVFAERTGRELAPLLPALYRRAGSVADREARRQYNAVWTALFVERFFAPIRAWCEDHGLVLVGHLPGDQSLRAHARCSGDFQAAIGALHEPGIDVIWGQIDGRRPRGFFPGFAGTLARRRQRCWSESYSVYGFGLTIAEMKRIADLQLLQGVNKFAPMYIQQSTRGGRGVATAARRLDDAPDAPWYPDLERYLAQLGRLVREAEAYRPLRLPYPIDALWASYDRRTSARFNRLAGAFADRSLGAVYDRDAPWPELGAATAAFWRAWPFAERLQADSWLRWQAYAVGEQAVALVVNVGGKRGGVTLSPSGHRYRLEPGESRLLDLTHPVADPGLVPLRRLRDWSCAIVERWVFRRGALRVSRPRPRWRAGALGSWREQWGAAFSGRCRYRIELDLTAAALGDSGLGDADPRELVLDLGRVEGAASVTVNGREAGRCAWAPYRVTLAGCLVVGRNRIEIDVAGSLANQVTAAATIRDLQDSGLYNVYMERSLDLERDRLDSGLYGPVRLLRPARGG